MLAYRRVLEFSSRVHTYLLSLFVFFSLMLLLCLYLPVSSAFFHLITTIEHVIAWVMLLEGAWVVLTAIYLTLISRVWCMKPALLTVVRISVMVAFSLMLDAFTIVFNNGLTIGVF